MFAIPQSILRKNRKLHKTIQIHFIITIVSLALCHVSYISCEILYSHGDAIYRLLSSTA
jgi:hypothetical protein